MSQIKNVNQHELSGLVSFSFKYLKKTDKYDYTKAPNGYMEKLIERLKDISTMDMLSFRQGANKSLRSHSVKWNDITEKSFGFPNEDTLVGDNAWQFSISANVYGRIIGFIIGNIFCIVWIDIEHLTYPKK